MITKKDIAKLEGLLMLVAVSENNSKKKVAEALNLSVDTLNKYISDLEKELGTKLVTSNGRGSVLTDEAQNIINLGFDIKKVVRSVDTLASHKDALSGTIRVGIPLAVSAALPSDSISTFWEEYPNIRIDAISNYEPPNFNVLDVDLGFTFEPPTGSDLVIVASRNVKYGFMATPEYLKKHGEPKSIEDLIANHRVCGKFGHYHYLKVWKDIMARSPRVCFSSNSNFSVIKILRAGGGIGVLPLQYANDGGLRLLTEIKETPEVTFYLVAHRLTKDIPKIRVVIDCYRKIMMSSWD